MVVRAGLGCIINADKPEKPRRVEVFPVTAVRIVQSLGMVLFADFTSLVAYGRDGKLWETGRLVWDNLEIGEVAGATLALTGFDAPSNNQAYPFTLNLLTG